MRFVEAVARTKEKTLVFARVLLRGERELRLFGGTAGLNAGAGRGEERSGRADYSEDGSWVFRRRYTSGLRVHREGDA